ncbi:hypothetical protein RD792_004212 [Penstemon davidsonii]|uniref:Uncharacterized protein n=1 Tax=Penstemon davidsonii TaxID=160366 RepID=A0ABR0DGS6_9LAMI|nr:hypothetical protein RD792_004212 [Penstemon davidsonii]
MGRSPCCDKIGLKRGPWTPEEDQKLLAYIEEHGHGSWRALPSNAGLQRCGKSCRLRWTNYLRPDIRRGKFSLQEEQTIIQLHALLGNRWSAIATHLPKRTDNDIKNYWNTHLKKRLAKMGIDPITHKPKNAALLSNDGPSKNTANLSHMAQWESARLEAEARLVKQSKLRPGPVNPASSSIPIEKPAGPARCLDVLNVWGNNMMRGGYGLESPTSTMSSSAAIMKDEGEEEWKQRNFAAEELNEAVGWGSESVGLDSSEHVPCGNFVEKFTDLLLSTTTSGAAKQLSEDDRESDNSGGGEFFEDNKNYWNSILNLVDSSPSDHSPIF